MKNTVFISFVFIFSILLIHPLPAQKEVTEYNLRSLDTLFPNLSAEQRERAFSENGYINSHGKNQPLTLIPAPGYGIDLPTEIMRSNPTYLTESLLIIPYSGRTLTKLDAYNALGRISDLQGRLYNSRTRGEEVPLFEDATRITSNRRNTIPDPPPAMELPTSETVYIRLRDANFGNTFYQADFTPGPYGVTFNLTNSRNITYILFTAMRAGRFNTIIYMEPLEEGMLIYSLAGVDVSDFVANRINIPSSIRRRLQVFISWVSDGLTY